MSFELGLLDEALKEWGRLVAFADAGYGLLSIRPEHALAVETLAPIHNNPFDRMLVAQAFSDLTLIT